MKITFPKDFIFGVATSSHQTEGNNTNNDWWKFEQELKVKDQEKSGLATNSYELYETDLKLVKDLSAQGYRFSLEWSRIEPREGEFDKKAILHYLTILKQLRKYKIKTFVTLQHFTNPLWFSKSGAWERKDSPEIFKRYTDVVIAELGEYIDFWITLNEPTLYTYFAYIDGSWPPEKKSYSAALRVINNQALGHRLAYDQIHEKYPKAMVGISSNNFPYYPQLIVDYPIAILFNKIVNYIFLDKIRKHQDFVGLNYYSPVRYLGTKNLPKTDMGWLVYPKGLGDITRMIWKRYKKPIFITENGLADQNDRQREKYISKHLARLHACIESGVDVRGYLHWSLLDNFEWALGYYPKFGLYEVNFDTQERKPRPSAKYYSEICKTNSLEI